MLDSQKSIVNLSTVGLIVFNTLFGMSLAMWYFNIIPAIYMFTVNVFAGIIDILFAYQYLRFVDRI